MDLPTVKKQPRWHVVYYVLAGFDLITVGLTLLLSLTIMSIYTASVDNNHVWSERAANISDLGMTLILVNSPGNDVFETDDPDTEEPLIKKYHESFTSTFKTIRDDILTLDDQVVKSKVLAALSKIKVNEAGIQSEAKLTFKLIRENKKKVASIHMAIMDQYFAKGFKNISVIMKVIRGKQEEMFTAEIEKAKGLKSYEYGIGFCIVTMVICVLFYGHAISNKMKQSQEEIDELIVDLTRSKDEAVLTKKSIEVKAKELEESGRYKSEFLANMSHELRTPLNSLLLLANHLSKNKDGNLTEEQVGDAKVIYEGGNDLLILINDIMDLSKVEAGKLELNFEVVDLERLSRTITSRFEPTARENNLDYNFVYENDVPKKIKTDPLRVQQVINNFLSNAFKFTEKGYVGIKIAKPEKSIVFENKKLNVDNAIAISISDSGVGIEESKTKVIFEAFLQEDGTITRKFGGTGLGLSISYSLSKLLGAEIQMTSVKGRGSTFTLFIPINLSDDEMTGDVDDEGDMFQRVNIDSKAKPRKENAKTSSSDLRVLLVDDDERNIYVLNKLLKSEFEYVVVARNGQEGLDKFNSEDKIDLIIMDIMMPVMNGYQAIEKIRSGSKNPEVKIVALTANAMPEDRQKCISAGADEYLTKPVKIEDLICLINKMLPRDDSI